MENRPLIAGQSHQFSFSTTQGGVFVAVLVWTDPPSPPLVQQLLVNDLDLSVFSTRTGQILGNGRFSSLGFAVRTRRILAVLSQSAPMLLLQVRRPSH
jgi:hypothetical protein